MRYVSKALAAAVAAGTLAAAAQAQVYRCVDAQGRRITADRPIPECVDRVQQVVHASGVVRTVDPSLSEAQMASQREFQRQAALEQAAQKEAARTNRALRARYPTAASFEQQRMATLGPLQERVAFARRMHDELAGRHQAALIAHTGKGAKAGAPSTELEFTTQQLRYQQSMLKNYEEELRALTAQFDQHLVRLRVLWAEDAATAAAAATTTTQLR